MREITLILQYKELFAYNKNMNDLEKSKKNFKKSTLNFNMIITTGLIVTFYLFICVLIVNYPIEKFNLILPAMSLTSGFWVVFFGIMFTINLCAFLIIEKQGANKKTKILFSVLCGSILLHVATFYMFKLLWVALFLSLLSLFFCLQLSHELKKTNKKAYTINLVSILICAYIIVNYYVVSMMN